MPTYREQLDAMLADAGLDPESKPDVLEGDLREHVWAPEREATFECDDHVWACERCGRKLRVMRKSDAEDEDEDEDDEGAAPEEPKPGEWETLGEAMRREKVNPNCASEVMEDVHLR